MTYPNKEWRERNPLKTKAHWKVQGAIRNGTLTKQHCEMCDSINTHAHHDDYSKPLEVRWLCSVHHKFIHNGLPKGRTPKPHKIPRLSSHKKYQPLKPNANIDKAKELRLQGFSYGKISQQLNYSRSQVFKWINDQHV